MKRLDPMTFALLGVFAVLMVVVPLWAGPFWISLLNDIGIAALVVLGLVLLTGIGGVTSFGQAAFVGIGAYASAWLSTSYAASPWLGLLLALALTCTSAWLIGLLTLRLGGHYLPLSTIAWGLSISLLFGNIQALGGHSGISDVPSITLGGWRLNTPASMFGLIWLCLAAALLFCSSLLNSRMGRVIRALRGGGILLASVGAQAFQVRLMLLVLSAFLAGLAGWLYVHSYRFISPAPFSLHASIDYMLMLVSGGLGQMLGAVTGSGLVRALQSALQDILPLMTQRGAQIQSIVFAVLFLLLLHHARAGVNGYLARWQRLPRKRQESMVQRLDVSDAAPLPRRTLPERGSPILRVEAAEKCFGGLIAVNQVSFEMQAGEIIGLIGPNGAGKSTMFNLLTGVAGLTSGQVHFMGKDVTALNQQTIAKLGMARTFQHVKLRPQMSLLENVALGAHMRSRHGLWRGGLALDAAEEKQIFAEAMHQLERIGLAGREHELAGNLPLGTQRILEIARALACDPVLLILDEPAAGLRRQEKIALGELLNRLRAEGVSILIVEHDMDFVMKLVDRLVVMNFGTKLCEGTPDVVRTDPKVRQAYLGEAA